MGRKRKSETNSNDSSSSSGQTHLSGSQRSAANDRERTRMRVLSKAFVRLKTSLPWVPSDTKLSKLDTLKLATSYIAYLSNILEEDERNGNCSNSLSDLDEHQPIKLIENIKSSSMEKFKKFNPAISNTYPSNVNYNNNNNSNCINIQNGFVKKVNKFDFLRNWLNFDSNRRFTLKCWPFVNSSTISTMEYGEKDSNHFYKMFIMNENNT